MATTDDLTLLAYVDGELDAATASAVEEELRDDPGAARKVRRLRESAALIRGAVNEPVHGPVPRDLVDVLTGPDRAWVPWSARRRGLIAAGIAAVLAAGLGGAYVSGLLAHRGDPPLAANDEMVDEIVSYHAFYAEHPPDAATAQADRGAMETWLSRHLGQPVRIPDLGGQGLEFRTARLFVYEDRPIAQIVYRSASGAPVALCIVAARGNASRPFEAMRRGGFNLVVWERSGSLYIVIGNESESRLRGLGSEISRKLGPV